MDPLDERGLVEENLGPALLAVAWVFAAIAFVVVASRYYVRLRIVQEHRLRVDDWLILITYVLAICNSCFCTISVHYGLGRHVQFLEPQQVLFAIKYVYLCEFFSIMSPGIGRISYAFLLLEIIPPTLWRKRFLWSIISAQFVVDVGCIIVSFSQCQPIEGFWEGGPNAHCWPAIIQEYAGFFQGSVCSLVDLLLAGFPASLFWSLKMKVSTKVSLSFLMGLGVFAMICSIIKTIQLRAIAEKDDPTYGMCVLAIWWTLEAYMVLIAASIPTLRPLTNRAYPSQTRSGGILSNTSKSHNLSHLRSQRKEAETSGNNDYPFMDLPSKANSRVSDDEIINVIGRDDRSETGSGVDILNSLRPSTAARENSVRNYAIEKDMSASGSYDKP